MSVKDTKVAFGLPFGPEIDMWSVGCILAELYMGEPLFPASNNDFLLTRMVGLLGPLPCSPFNRGKFHNQLRGFIGKIQPPHVTVSKIKNHLKGSSDYNFVTFLLGMLKYNPDERMSVSEAFQHAFIAPEVAGRFLVPDGLNKFSTYSSLSLDSSLYIKAPEVSADIAKECLFGVDLLRRGTFRRAVAEVSPFLPKNSSPQLELRNNHAITGTAAVLRSSNINSHDINSNGNTAGTMSSNVSNSLDIVNGQESHENGSAVFSRNNSRGYDSHNNRIMSSDVSNRSDARNYQEFRENDSAASSHINNRGLDSRINNRAMNSNISDIGHIENDHEFCENEGQIHSSINSSGFDSRINNLARSSNSVHVPHDISQVDSSLYEGSNVNSLSEDSNGILLSGILNSSVSKSDTGSKINRFGLGSRANNTTSSSFEGNSGYVDSQVNRGNGTKVNLGDLKSEVNSDGIGSEVTSDDPDSEVNSGYLGSDVKTDDLDLDVNSDECGSEVYCDYTQSEGHSDGLGLEDNEVKANNDDIAYQDKSDSIVSQKETRKTNHFVVSKELPKIKCIEGRKKGSKDKHLSLIDQYQDENHLQKPDESGYRVKKRILPKRVNRKHSSPHMLLSADFGSVHCDEKLFLQNKNNELDISTKTLNSKNMPSRVPTKSNKNDRLVASSSQLSSGVYGSSEGSRKRFDLFEKSRQLLLKRSSGGFKELVDEANIKQDEDVIRDNCDPYDIDSEFGHVKTPVRTSLEKQSKSKMNAKDLQYGSSKRDEDIKEPVDMKWEKRKSLCRKASSVMPTCISPKNKCKKRLEVLKDDKIEFPKKSLYEDEIEDTKEVELEAEKCNPFYKSESSVTTHTRILLKNKPKERLEESKDEKSEIPKKYLHQDKIENRRTKQKIEPKHEKCNPFYEKESLFTTLTRISPKNKHQKRLNKETQIEKIEIPMKALYQDEMECTKEIKPKDEKHNSLYLSEYSVMTHACISPKYKHKKRVGEEVKDKTMDIPKKSLYKNAIENTKFEPREEYKSFCEKESSVMIPTRISQKNKRKKRLEESQDEKNKIPQESGSTINCNGFVKPNGEKRMEQRVPKNTTVPEQEKSKSKKRLKIELNESPKKGYLLKPTKTTMKIINSIHKKPKLTDENNAKSEKGNVPEKSVENSPSIENTNVLKSDRSLATKQVIERRSKLINNETFYLNFRGTKIKSPNEPVSDRRNLQGNAVIHNTVPNKEPFPRDLIEEINCGSVRNKFAKGKRKNVLTSSVSSHMFVQDEIEKFMESEKGDLQLVSDEEEEDEVLLL